MGSRPFSRLACRSAIIAALLGATSWAADTTKIIYSFAGNADGEYLDTELVRDNAGNLYGTSVQGGTFGGGTVFQLTPAGVHTVLYTSLVARTEENRTRASRSTRRGIFTARQSQVGADRVTAGVEWSSNSPTRGASGPRA
jgi:uncharacterized repeat protein (TIGR03803 family)